MNKARQFTKLFGLAGLAAFLLSSGITSATAQPSVPENTHVAAEHGPTMG